MATLHAKRCRYCRELVGPSRPATWDHLVPQWVLRYYSERFRRNHRFRESNYVTACIICNNGKGPMPAATFVQLRLKPEKLAEVRREWAIIAAQVRRGDRLVHKDRVYAEFSRPLPAHFPIGDKPVILAPSSQVQADWVKG